MTLKTIIIDDEIDSLEVLKFKIEKFCPMLDIIGHTQVPEEGKRLIEELNPDVVFLDIEMPRMNGFKLLNELGAIQFHVIFTTAYNHYAIEAVRVNAFDYLTKPIVVQDLQNCIDRLLHVISNPTDDQKPKVVQEPFSHMVQESRIIIPTSESIDFVKVADVIYLTASGNYTTFALKNNQKILVSKNLGEYENTLLDFGFFRTHNSYLINLSHVVKFIREEGGSIIMSDGTSIAISRRKKDEFIEIMKKRSIL